MTQPLSNWDAAAFFESLTKANCLAATEGFAFCRVSGLDGFEEALAQIQSVNNFICVSDIADGYTELHNTPRTRRVKTVFFAMRHAVDDMAARARCMETMREIFRQFMSVLFLEKVRIEQDCIFLDPRISFTEVDRYFFSGCACAYFQVAVDKYTDLSYQPDEWSEPMDGRPVMRYLNITTTPYSDYEALRSALAEHLTWLDASNRAILLHSAPLSLPLAEEHAGAARAFAAQIALDGFFANVSSKVEHSIVTPIAEDDLATIKVLNIISLAPDKTALNTVKAIKEFTGWGLAEAKHFVDTLPHYLEINPYFSGTDKFIHLIQSLEAQNVDFHFSDTPDID